MKKVDLYLKEYVVKLSDDNLKFLAGRFNQKLGGDMAEVVNFLSETHEMDRWLSSAKGANDLYDILDMVEFAVDKEYERRER